MDPRWEVVLFALYVVPSLVVAARRPTKTLLVIAVNLLLGWTIIGWFVSVALALLLPPAAAQPSQSGALQANGAATAAIPEPPAMPTFVIDPIRVAALSLVASLVYQYWWFWRFFEFARRERFPRSRSFWWILVPFYGWAVVGRLFQDLETRLGPLRPAGYSAQAALALVIASDVSAGWAVTLRSFPLVVGTLALSGVFCASALYQVQAAVNAYLRITHRDARPAGLLSARASHSPVAWSCSACSCSGACPKRPVSPWPVARRFPPQPRRRLPPGSPSRPVRRSRRRETC